MARTTIIAFGTRGDVQPLIALGVGLREAGHAVRIATQEKFCELATESGLPCVPIAADVQLPSQKKAKTGFQSPYTLYRLAQEYLGNVLMGTWEASKDAEALIFSDWGRIPAEHIVEKLDVPAFMSFIHPQQMKFLYRETQVYGPRWGWLTSLLRKQILWHTALSGPVNKWRKEILGLPATSFWKSERLLKHRQAPFFYAYSPAVFPKPANWPAWLHVTGYCFLERSTQWQPPAGLTEFLASGPPPVYVGFSSMSNRKIEKLTDVVVQGLSLAQQRGILAAGWSDFGKRPALPDHVFAVDAVPHDWLFPRIAAAVHHGGAGTTGAAFRAGIPQVVIPFDLDQPFWAWRVQELGVGSTVPHKNLTAERFAQAIAKTVHDEDVKARAADLGKRVREEDGVARASALFEQYLHRQR